VFVVAENESVLVRAAKKTQQKKKTKIKKQKQQPARPANKKPNKN